MPRNKPLKEFHVKRLGELLRAVDGTLYQVDMRDGNTLVNDNQELLAIIESRLEGSSIVTHDKILSLLKQDWNWLNNSNCKHITLYKSPKGLHLFDRLKRPITVEELEYQ